jgi:methylthioxylose transferase
MTDGARRVGSTGGRQGSVLSDDPPPEGPGPRRRMSAEVVALAVAGLLLAAAFAAEPLGWWGGNVRQFLPPLSANVHPAFGPGLPLAVAVGAAVVWWGPRLAGTLPWRRLLGATWLAGVLWGFGLALLRGWSGGVAAPLAGEDESLVDVPRVEGIGEMLRVYTDRILLTAPDHWTTYESGHPPLPLMFYVALDRIGLGGPGAGGVVAALIGSTGVVAVLVTLRILGDERRARAAAPFLAVTSLVIWIVVSTDAVLMATVAWGLALLAAAATSARTGRRLALSVAAGLVLGSCLFLSYGLVLAGAMVVAVLVAARAWRPLLPALLASLAVVGAFAAAGFWWLEGMRLLEIRYYQGKGGVRPYGYWVWGNLAVAAFALGPAVVAGLGRVAARVREWRTAPPTVVVAVGALVAILAATISGLSKSEVERIWLPFMLWLVPLSAYLPERHRRRWLIAAAGYALVIGIVYRTTW